MNSLTTYSVSYSGPVLLAVVLTLAVWSDIHTRRIPNGLIASGLIAGTLLHSVLPVGEGLFGALPGGAGPLFAFEGAAAGLAIFLPLYTLRAVGAGDVKLMGAIGAFVGPFQILGVALLAFLAGGVLAIAVAVWTGSVARVLNNVRLMVLVAVSGRSAGLSMSEVQTTGHLPYAVPIACGTGLNLWLVMHRGWPFA